MHRITSEIGELIIRPARADEVERFLLILEEAENWLHGRGIKQWLPGIHRPQLAALEKWVQQGDVFLAEYQNEIVATAALKQSTPVIWKDRPRSAMYLSKLTSRRRFAGHHLGATMLSWCETYSGRLGFEAVRLDCWAENPPLCGFYRRAGYTDVGDIDSEGGFKLKLFEKLLERK